MNSQNARHTKVSTLAWGYFLLLMAILFAAGAQAGELFHVEEQLYDAAGQDIRETLAAGEDKKETKTN